MTSLAGSSSLTLRSRVEKQPLIVRGPAVTPSLMNAFLFAVLAVTAVGCATQRVVSPPAIPAAPSTPATSDAVIVEGTGPHSRPVTTRSAEAQRFFDQGLNLLYAFNHDEAIRSFRRAAELDPNCAMAFWGIAVANGPHINNPMVSPQSEKTAWDAIERAKLLAPKADPTERALIAALSTRHANPTPADRKPLDTAYAEAMRSLWQHHPKDADIGALFAESMMDLRPWDLWQADGRPQPGTDEIIATLEQVMRLNQNHPLAIHLYIHAVEASNTPERADAPADRLRNLTPGLGHLVHMPSHVDVRRGRWEHAIVSNEKAMVADGKYRALRPHQGFYGVYVAHNHHMLAFAAMMNGQSAKAIAAIDKLVNEMPEDWKAQFPTIADGYLAMPLEVRMRFGRWDEILAAPEPAPQYPIARALRLYARGVALAAQGKTTAARAEQKAFIVAKAAIPQDAFFGNNPASGLMAVAERVLEGEIAYREGKVNPAIASLEAAVTAEDGLRYDEPPDWILPVRHALGAVLLHKGLAAAAERVYRQDLAKLPNNGWALYGLEQSLRAQKKNAEANKVKTELEATWAKADFKLDSSCACQPWAQGNARR